MVWQLENKWSCSSEHWGGAGCGNSSGFGIQRQQCGKDWGCPVPGSSRMLIQDTEPSPGAHLGSFHHRVRRNCCISMPSPNSTPKNNLNYTTGTNWILFWAFQKRGQGLSSLETKLPHEFPRTAPWRCSAARDSCGTSENTDFTFWGFCSFQLSPAFKSTYIKRKLNCPLQQRANHNKANILQQTLPLNPLKTAKSTFQCPLPIPGCQQHQCHSGLLSATSCGKNRPEIFHIPTRFHIPRASNTSHSFPAGALQREGEAPTANSSTNHNWCQVGMGECWTQPGRQAELMDTGVQQESGRNLF